jgi:hypothetical protein
MKRIAIALLLLTGCATVPRNFDDTLALAYLQGDAVATTIIDLCGADMPGGNCAPGAAVTTEQRDWAKRQLLNYADGLDAAMALRSVGDERGAIERLQQAQALLRYVQTRLERAL